MLEDQCQQTKMELTIEQDTLKACKDNFKGYSDFQLRHVLNKENVSVYDQFFQRKTEHILDPNVACGKHFYADLKIEYFGNGSPGGFPDVPEGDVQDEALFQCVKACIRHNRDFLPMITYMEAAGQLNVLNLHALLGTAMKVTPDGKRNERTDAHEIIVPKYPGRDEAARGVHLSIHPDRTGSCDAATLH